MPAVYNIFKPADAKLKRKVDDVEDKLKKEKELEVKVYFEECCSSHMVAHPVMTFALVLGAIVGAAALVTRAIQGMHDQAHPVLSNLKEKTRELKKANEDLVASTDKVIKKEEANIALAREKEQSVAKSIDKLDRLIQKKRPERRFKQGNPENRKRA